MALTPMRLRLESAGGRAEEFRIRNGIIEVRSLQGNSDAEREWQRVTPEQLTDHVNRNTAVAQWLMRRLGWRRLLRACIADWELFDTENAHLTSERNVA